MQIPGLLLNITTYSTVLSVVGGFCVSSAAQDIRLTGFLMWILSNCIWCGYFLKTKQYNPFVMFLIYLVTSIIGAYNNL